MVIKPYILTFIPIFIAVNAWGSVPLYLSLTGNLTKEEKQKIIRESIITATLIALLFMFIGKGIFLIMEVTIPDFQIGGGILLLILSVNLLLSGGDEKYKVYKDVGIFPLGTPLIAGPAVLVIILVLIDTYGPLPTIVSFILNMLVVWITFGIADTIVKLLGRGEQRPFLR